MEPIYKNIRRRRQELKMTQDELARKLGYTSRSSIAKIEAGLVPISTRRAVDFANALNMDVSSLIGWTFDENDVPSYSRVLRTKDELIQLIAQGDYSAEDLAEIAKAAIDQMIKKSPGGAGGKL